MLFVALNAISGSDGAPDDANVAPLRHRAAGPGPVQHWPDHLAVRHVIELHVQVVGLLTLALTALLRALDEVLREALRAARRVGHLVVALLPNSVLEVDGRTVPVVSGGAHQGRRAFIAAADLALLGRLYLAGGRRGQRQLVSSQWMTRPGRRAPSSRSTAV